MSHGSFYRNQRTGSREAGAGKTRVTLNLAGEPVAEETRRRNDQIGLPESLHDKIAQAGAHGITDEQRAREHGNGRCHTKHYGQVGAPIVAKAVSDELNGSHFQIAVFRLQI